MNNEIKYSAKIVYYEEQYAEIVSPFFDTAAEVSEWCKANGVEYNSIQPASNWRELKQVTK